MMLDGTYTATVDRIVDEETAVILLEDDDDIIEQLDVPIEELPEAGRDEGSVLAVTVADGEFVTAEFRPEETANRSVAIEEKLDRLSRRLSEE